MFFTQGLRADHSSSNRSWVTYYFRSRFDLDEGRLGSVFFTTSIISAASVIVASALAKRLGNVKVPSDPARFSPFF